MAYGGRCTISNARCKHFASQSNSHTVCVLGTIEIGDRKPVRKLQRHAVVDVKIFESVAFQVLIGELDDVSTLGRATVVVRW